MNKGLLVFSIILILGGVYIGVNLLILLGIFLLIPALISKPRSQSKIPVSTKEQPRPTRRIIPVAPPAARVDYSQPPPGPSPSAPLAPSYVPPQAPMGSGTTYAPPMFPTVMFPSMSIPSSYRAPAPDTKERQPGQNDELVEFGVLVAVLRLAFS